MIINFLEKGLEVISHPAHGLLSGKIANELKERPFSKYWMETLIAISEHDDAQVSNRMKQNISPIGMPMDFVTHTIPLDKTLIHAKAVFKKVLEKSCWSAMLLSHHLEFLYEDRAEGLHDFKLFLEEMKRFRLKALSLHNVNANEIEDLYKIMLFADRLSLILCQNEIPALERKLEINKSIDGKRYFIHQNNEGTITVEPWPFRETEFNLSVDTRLLPELKFENEEIFGACLRESPIKLKTFQFTKV